MDYSSASFPSAVTRGAYRIPPVNAAFPTLTWHMGFWNPQSSDEEQKNARGDRACLCRSLDQYLSDLFAGLDANPSVDELEIYPFHDGHVALFDDVFEVQAVDKARFGSRQTLGKIDASKRSREEINILMQERRLVVLVFIWRSIKFEVRFELRTEYFVFTVFANISNAQEKTKENKENLIELFQSNFCPEKVDASQFGRDLRKYFRSEFWNKFLTLMNSAGKAEWFTNSNSLFANRFCDAKGVCIPSKVDDSRDASGIMFDKDVCRNVERFVTEKDYYDCTASYMAGRKLIFMTDLGQSVFNSNSTEASSVFFVLLVKTEKSSDSESSESSVSAAQLGRVLHRIHMLGTVRLAAVRQINEITRASRRLSELDPDMRDARASLSDKDIENARKAFSLVTSEYLENDDTRSGLQYRVERSRYYVNIFRENVKSLRIARIEGYQKYNDFVERKMGEKYDFIHRVGLRYERAATSLSLIEQTFLAEKSEKTSESLNDIQRWGELVLLGFLLPYYLAAFIEHFSHDKDEHSPKAVLGEFFILCVAFVAFSSAAARFIGWESLRNRSGFPQFSFMIAAYVLIGVIFLELSGDHNPVIEGYKLFWAGITSIYDTHIGGSAHR